MGNRNEWEEFFDGHAPVYNENPFTSNTVKEVDFLIEELQLPKGSSILDMGCGTGRHSIELARRGFKMTGVDISSGMLATATRDGQQAEVEVEWIHADATQFTSDRLFDAAICLCEGAFGLLGKDGDSIEHSLSILRNINLALRPEARVIFTVLNGFAQIRRCSQEDVEQGRFNPLTMAEVSDQEYDTAEGSKKISLRERGFIPTELVMLFNQTGFEVEHIGGGTAGNWGRRMIDMDEVEIMITGKKRRNIA
ncbi:methyltransferase domain-containing protein [Acidobacteria bacterium AH-259-D05]|nr:methyltransferase domain-containing protein [Acidobacteria bacterium AH-259-D05]